MTVNIVILSHIQVSNSGKVNSNLSVRGGVNRPAKRTLSVILVIGISTEYL